MDEINQFLLYPKQTNIKVIKVNVIETHKQRRINVCMKFGYVSDNTMYREIMRQTRVSSNKGSVLSDAF